MHHKPVHCCGILTDSELGQIEVALHIFVRMRDKETKNETVPVKPGHTVILTYYSQEVRATKLCNTD